MRIDAHQHYWELGRGDYGWITPELAPICRDFGPSDLQPHLEHAGIDGTVLVQAAASEAETHFLLSLAAQASSRVLGVAGWLDFEASDAAARVQSLARHRLLRGLRPVMQDMADLEWMMKPELSPALSAMAECGLCFDALIRPHHLPVLRRFAQRWPQLRIVIDHAAKPRIATGGFDAWAKDMRMLARDTMMSCKLSGLVTEAAPGWTWRDLRPYVNVLLQEFGDKRLLWGSDWPVVNLAGGYEAWREATSQLLAACSPAQCEQILGANAVEFYGL